MTACGFFDLTGGGKLFKKLFATAVALVLCLMSLCACQNYDAFYFYELVFSNVRLGMEGWQGGEAGVDYFSGAQLISSVEEYVEFCIRWDMNLAGEYEDERMENLKENMRRCGYNFFSRKSFVVIGYYVGVGNAYNLVKSVAVEGDALVLNYKEIYLGNGGIATPVPRVNLLEVKKADIEGVTRVDYRRIED